jgi:hypothetical protein
VVCPLMSLPELEVLLDLLPTSASGLQNRCGKAVEVIREYGIDPERSSFAYGTEGFA